MFASRLPQLIATSALFAVLGLTSACNSLEGLYDNMADKQSEPKPVVKSPAAAPVQDVNTQDLTTPPQATTPPQQPVELGSMSDQPATAAFATSSAIEQPTTEATAPATPITTAATATDTAMAPAAPAQLDASAPAVMPSTSLNNALLTVRFNQPHVYYDDALSAAISQAEQAKPGVMYDVLSTVPDLSVLPADQQQKLASRAKDNLRNVVIKMQQFGVPADRIRIAEQVLKIRSQEIQLFVR